MTPETGRLYRIVIRGDWLLRDEDIVAQYLGEEWFYGEGGGKRFRFHPLVSDSPPTGRTDFTLRASDFEKYCTAEVFREDLPTYFNWSFRTPHFDRVLKGA